MPGANFVGSGSVDYRVFRPRYRRPPFAADPLNWTDYRWETGPWRPERAAWAPRPSRRRGRRLLRLLLIGLAILVGARLFSSRQGSGSWARRGLYAALLLLVAGAFSRNQWRRGGWI